MNNSHPENGQEADDPALRTPTDAAATDPFAPYRRRPKRSFWMLGLQPVEAGDLLSPEHHSRVLELLPEDGIAIPCAGARGELVFLVSIPEEQLAAFAEGEWRVGHRFEGENQLVLALWVGGEETRLVCQMSTDNDDLALTPQPPLPRTGDKQPPDPQLWGRTADLTRTGEEPDDALTPQPPLPRTGEGEIRSPEKKLDIPLECPFVFNLRDEAQLQGAIQLTERQEVDFYGLTHMEEGLMLTLKGSVELPLAFREEVKGELLERLAGMAGGG